MGTLPGGDETSGVSWLGLWPGIDDTGRLSWAGDLQHGWVDMTAEALARATHVLARPIHGLYCFLAGDSVQPSQVAAYLTFPGDRIGTVGAPLGVPVQSFS